MCHQKALPKSVTFLMKRFYLTWSKVYYRPCMMWMAHLLYQQSLHTKKNNPPFQMATYCLTEFDGTFDHGVISEKT